MGTLHTNSAVKTLERILTLYTAEEQESAAAGESQNPWFVLSPRVYVVPPTVNGLLFTIFSSTQRPSKITFAAAKMTKFLELMKDGEYHGMITTNQSLFNLYQEGRITDEVALAMSPVPNELAMMLRGRI
jgi:twitching motility protein PilT